jgi:hypothetical protein
MTEGVEHHPYRGIHRGYHPYRVGIGWDEKPTSAKVGWEIWIPAFAGMTEESSGRGRSKKDYLWFIMSP